MAISAALRAHSESIAGRWLRGAVTGDVDPGTMGFAERLPDLLDGLALWADGSSEQAIARLRTFADAHALERHRANSSLGQVLDEYARLRRAVVESIVEVVEPAELVKELAVVDA